MEHLSVVAVLAVLFTLFMETEANPFVYNYERLRIGGLVVVGLLVAGGLGVLLLVSLVLAEEQNYYHRLRVGGLILAAVLCLIGITILFKGGQEAMLSRCSLTKVMLVHLPACQLSSV
ncbi:hypothetical protein FQN60_016891 [Etheostoma spectabile]|uniref:FXYD domain-containing ion transport regulator n=1 Tax=Etheostoma spectabile TaxID=54343 RepID=A0A5J5DDX9_9PERO|nr:hypothetical protein FQN60_016891 [Etheostoma spectabile]